GSPCQQQTANGNDDQRCPKARFRFGPPLNAQVVQLWSRQSHKFVQPQETVFCRQGQMCFGTEVESFKHQSSSIRGASSHNPQIKRVRLFCPLKLGTWSFPGAWSLKLGAFPTRMTKKIASVKRLLQCSRSRRRDG